MREGGDPCAGSRWETDSHWWNCLVVIAIVAILMGMLLPALARARESARRVVCAGRMKQIGLSLMMYSNNNQERVPYLNPLPASFPGSFTMGTYLRHPYNWDGPTLVTQLLSYGAHVNLLSCPSATVYNPPVKDCYGNDYCINYLYLCGLDEITKWDTLPVWYDNPPSACPVILRKARNRIMVAEFNMYAQGEAWGWIHHASNGRDNCPPGSVYSLQALTRYIAGRTVSTATDASSGRRRR